MRLRAGGPYQVQAAIAALHGEARHAVDTDWPQILGPNRNGIYSGPEIVPSFPRSGPPQIWTRNVGAGFAGLTAARELTQQGRTVKILEARDRIAGRVVHRCLHRRGSVARRRRSGDVGDGWSGDGSLHLQHRPGVDVRKEEDADRAHADLPESSDFTLSSLQATTSDAGAAAQIAAAASRLDDFTAMDQRARDFVTDVRRIVVADLDEVRRVLSERLAGGQLELTYLPLDVTHKLLTSNARLKQLAAVNNQASKRVVDIPVQILEKRPPSINLFKRVPNVLKSVAKLTYAIRIRG